MSGCIINIDIKFILNEAAENLFLRAETTPKERDIPFAVRDGRGLTGKVSSLRSDQAMEGRGSKIQPAILDKLAAFLEEADPQSQFEACKLVDREPESQERKAATTPIPSTGHGVPLTTRFCTPPPTCEADIDDKRRKEKRQQNAHIAHDTLCSLQGLLQVR